MTYQNSLEYFKELENSGYNPDHKNSVTLMNYLDNRQNTLPIIHVAGTNGKGSTISFIRSILVEAGYSVGTFMSPHIFDYKELIEDNQVPIAEEAFAHATGIVKEACDQMVIDGHNHPTVFECLVGVAIVHFAAVNHDFVIVEVGLGGRDDATNIFDQPLLSIITPISYDHEAILGDSIEQIALHKAGIARKGTPLLLAPNPIEVVSAVSNYVREIDGNMYLMDEGFIHVNTFAKTKTKKIFSIKTTYYNYRNLHTSMLGHHQEINISMALLAIYRLGKTYDIPESAIKEGIKKTTWSCRNEILSVEPLILLDGGHNPAGSLALADLVTQHYSDYEIMTVFGVMADKNYQAMLKTLVEISNELIVTMPMSDRALDPTGLDLDSVNIPYHIIPSMEEALELALKKQTNKSLLLITGSLYLTHPAKVWLTDKLEL